TSHRSALDERSREASDTGELECHSQGNSPGPVRYPEVRGMGGTKSSGCRCCLWPRADHLCGTEQPCESTRTSSPSDGSWQGSPGRHPAATIGGYDCRNIGSTQGWWR